MGFAGTRFLKIKIDGTEYDVAVSSAKVVSKKAEAGFTSFADAAAGGGRDYALKVKHAVDYAEGTLWDQIFSNAGSTVAVVMSPYGAGTFTAAEPGFSMNATISEPDGDFIGTDADPSTTAKTVIEFEWPLTAKPTRLVTGSY